MPKQSRTRIAEIIAERSHSQSAKSLAQAVAAYLLSEGRVDELDSILRDVMQLRAEHGAVEVMAHAVRPLSVGTRNSIEAQTRRLFPAAKQIIISEQLDPDLVGGVRLEYANQQLDLSVRAQLNRFKQLTAA